MNRKKERIIIAIYVLALTAVALPLLILGFYSFPIADDWSFGAEVYQCLKNEGGFLRAIVAAVHTAWEWRLKEPRFMNAFLGALQPGVWNERAYWITAWLAIGGVIFSELSLAAFLLRGEGKRRFLKSVPIVVPSLVCQLLYVPFPVETFYWWTGAVNYTVIFSISLILMVLFAGLTRACTVKKRVVLTVCGVVLSVLVGGNNYATSLSMACLFVSLSAVMAIKNRKALYRTLPVTLTLVVCLAICLMAPGNQTRLTEEFGGVTTGPINAVWMSLIRTATNIYSWTRQGIIVMLLLIAPFLWRALKGVNCTFRYPLLFTVYTFGIYASQIVATMYVGGNTGGGRMADILYYAYHVWILLNMGYWLGWLQKRHSVMSPVLEAIRKIYRRIGAFRWVCAAGILFTLWLGMGIKESSTYRAMAWLLKGEARAYKQAWEERLEILHDDSVREVLFAPLPGYPGEMIYYADFQTGENWINSACARYYGKDYVGLEEEP